MLRVRIGDLPEPWLRGTHAISPVVVRAAVHAVELADEDVHNWCEGLAREHIDARPCGIEPVSFHLRHLAGSLDRLLTYAEGKNLTEMQLTELGTEMSGGKGMEELLAGWNMAREEAIRRLHALATCDLDVARSVGRRQTATFIGGIIVHIADHTQRHAGQLITTVKVARGSVSVA